MTRNHLLATLTVLLTLLGGLAGTEWLLRWQRDAIQASDHMDPGMVIYDPLLGWRLKPGWNGTHRHHDFQVHYRINSQGLRGREPPIAPGGLAILGDSFTFGIGVDEGESFPALLDQAHGNVLNMGIPGYSTDQELLLMEAMERRLPRHLLLVVYLGNDLVDNLRDYPLQADQAKPRFQFRNGRLRLTNTPVPRTPKPAAARHQTLASLLLGEDARPQPLSQWEILRRLGLFQPRPRLDEAGLVAKTRPALTLFHALVDKMRDRQRQRGGRFAVALLAGRSFVTDPDGPSARYQDHLRRRLLQSLPPRGIPVIDLAAPLRDSTEPHLYHPNEGHLTARGHQRIAHLLSGYLSESGWLP